MSGKRPEQADPEAELEAQEESAEVGRAEERDPESDTEERRADAGAQGRGAEPGRDLEDAGSGAPESDVDGMRQEIESLTTELDELRDRHLRLAAEFDNFRKRTVRERAQEAQRAQGEIVRELLDSLDDLQRVSREGSSTEDAAALLEGVQLVEKKLQRTLERSGLQPVDAIGEPFDPEVHEALTTVPTEDPDQDGIVSHELTRGYVFKDLLLRPALVEVKKYQGGGREGAAEEDAAEADDES